VPVSGRRNLATAEVAAAPGRNAPSPAPARTAGVPLGRPGPVAMAAAAGLPLAFLSASLCFLLLESTSVPVHEVAAPLPVVAAPAPPAPDPEIDHLVAAGGETETLDEVMKRSNVVIATTGCPGLISPEMVRKGSVILALTNPKPEIEPEVAMHAGASFAADGKSNNQRQCRRTC